MKFVITLLSLFLSYAVLMGCSASPPQTEPFTTAPGTTEPASSYPEPDKLIALTFDDGPNAHMNTMIKTLNEYDAKATFFVIGKYVSNYGNVISQAFASQHEIGNHSFSHEDMTLKTAPEIQDEISLTQRLVSDIIGQEPVWYRPPFFRH